MNNALRAGLLASALIFSNATAQQPEAVTAPPAAPASAETPLADAAASSEAEAQMLAQAQAFYESLNRRTGVIAIANNFATLNVPDTHYFIGPEDARRVIVELWGNPPGSATNVEGMIFPRDGNPALGAWGAVVEYANEGYVSDADASTTDYDQLLADMQAGADQENEARTAQGYPSVSLVGWAERPHYDAATHKIYWGKHLRFSGETVDTLNYDIRVLGREGHLVVSFISTMPELEAIRASIPAVLAMAEFSEGHRYADYQQGDQRAAYGIGGLIAGGAVAAVAQKTGLLALIVAFGKKFVVLIGAGLLALFGFVRRMFGGRSES